MTNIQRIGPERTYVWQKYRPNLESKELGLIQQFKVSFPDHSRQLVLSARRSVNILLEVDVLFDDTLTLGKFSHRFGSARIITLLPGVARLILKALAEGRFVSGLRVVV